MDLFAIILSTLLAGFSLILVVIATAAASRYRDPRLGSVAGAQGLFGVIGLLSLIHQLSPRYGGGFAVDPIPLALAVVAVGLLYVALIRRRSESVAGPHG